VEAQRDCRNSAPDRGLAATNPQLHYVAHGCAIHLAASEPPPSWHPRLSAMLSTAKNRAGVSFTTASNPEEEISSVSISSHHLLSPAPQY
jgi:hypothetical protein